MSELLEELAAIEHDQWIEWASSIIRSENISESRKKRWESLFVPYSELSEEMKEADRKYARIIMKKVEQENAALKGKLLEIKRRVARVITEHCCESPLGHNKRLEEKITIILEEIGEE